MTEKKNPKPPGGGARRTLDPRPEGFSAGEPASIPRVGPEWQDEELSTRLTEATVAFPPPAPEMKGRTRAILTVISGPSTGRTFSVRDAVTVLGRGKEAQVRLDDAGVSRAHARIVWKDDGAYLLEDLGSTNGTFVGGSKIGRVELRSGDRIHVGPNAMVSFAILDSQAEMMTQQLYESAMRDPLTRAYNRRYFLERASSELAFAVRHKGLLALIMIDIDHFKRINDTYGHTTGDEVLREVSAQVMRMIRMEDVFARYGGEEFVLVVRGIEHDNVGRFAERLRAAVGALSIAVESGVVRTTISAGFASLSELSEADRNVQALIELSDARLYRAKADGRNRCYGT